MAQQIKVKKDAAYLEAIEEMRERELEEAARPRTLFLAWRQRAGISASYLSWLVDVSTPLLSKLEHEWAPTQDEVKLSLEELFGGAVVFDELFATFDQDPEKLNALDRAFAANGARWYGGLRG
jgi:predicted transcriptional regulator